MKKENKKGISLIVLVITIIIMIIIAGAIILALNSAGIIEKATAAKEDTNVMVEYERLDLAVREAVLEGHGVVDIADLTGDTDGSLLKQLKKIYGNDFVYEGDGTVTVGGIIYKIDEGGEIVEVELQIWKAKSILDDIAYYPKNSTYILLESTYNQETEQEYKDKYISKHIDNGLWEGISLDDVVMSELEVTTIEDAMKKAGVTGTRNEFIYERLFESVAADVGEDEKVNAVLESLGYNVDEIKQEFAMKTQDELPEVAKTKTYTITYPDGTTEIVKGENVGTYVKKYKVTENGIYEISISDGRKTQVIRVEVENIAPATDLSYKDEHYTYERKATASATTGYKVKVNDNTLEEYAPILEEIDGIKITNMDSTFEGCKKLKEAPVIPNGVTNMDSTFYGCSSLTKIPVIPAGVTDIEYAFYNCSKLTESPNVPAGVTSLKYTFYGCSSLNETPEVPAGVTNMQSAFYGCKSLTKAPVIPNGVKRLDSAFTNCSELIETPNIPSTVTRMNNTFSNCGKLTKPPNIPDQIVDLYYTFYGCKSLTEMPIIPEGVTSMDSTFYNCSSLAKATVIPAGVSDMPSTFFGCSLLSGTLTINATSLSSYSNSLYGVGTKGTGLTVIVPNETVRNNLIKRSGYDKTYVSIVGE